MTLKRVGFFIAKAHFYDGHREKLNIRQAKAIERMFREGPDGFEGGLSAENYISIAGTSRATATRSLQDLGEIGAFTRTGERKAVFPRSVCLSLHRGQTAPVLLQLLLPQHLLANATLVPVAVVKRSANALEV